MTPALPDDMIYQEILIRLPLKSLARFRYVCKDWKSVISDPDFIKPLINRSISQNPNDEYLIRAWRGGVAILSQTNLCESAIDKVPYPVYCRDYIRMVGCINGLVCFARLSKPYLSFILWNPALHLSKKILVPAHLCHQKNTDSFLVGFSWDSVEDDYKLIAICTSISCKRLPSFVYSSKTNCWSNSPDRPLVYGRKFPSVIVKGIPYWKCSPSLILKFEARNNVFTYLTVSRDIGEHYSLLDLNDRFALVDFAGRADGMGVYQYDEENNGWCKMLTVNFHLKNGIEIVFNGDFDLMDSKSNKIKRLAYEINRFSTNHAHSYTPSLVVLEGMKSLHLPPVKVNLEQIAHELITVFVGKSHL